MNRRRFITSLALLSVSPYLGYLAPRQAEMVEVVERIRIGFVIHMYEVDLLQEVVRGHQAQELLKRKLAQKVHSLCAKPVGDMKFFARKYDFDTMMGYAVSQNVKRSRLKREVDAEKTERSMKFKWGEQDEKNTD